VGHAAALRAVDEPAHHPRGDRDPMTARLAPKLHHPPGAPPSCRPTPAPSPIEARRPERRHWVSLDWSGHATLRHRQDRAANARRARRGTRIAVFTASWGRLRSRYGRAPIEVFGVRRGLWTFRKDHPFSVRAADVKVAAGSHGVCGPGVARRPFSPPRPVRRWR
jgi:hypothetical protein